MRSGAKRQGCVLNQTTPQQILWEIYYLFLQNIIDFLLQRNLFMIVYKKKYEFLW
jgi:hypothetical protein